MSYISLVYGPVLHETFVAQWLEHPTGVRKIMASILPRTQTSLFWWKCARKGRREGDNGRDVASPAVYTLPMVPCGSSPVTRFALASAMRKTKRLRRRLGSIPVGDFFRFFPCSILVTCWSHHFSFLDRAWNLSSLFITSVAIVLKLQSNGYFC